MIEDISNATITTMANAVVAAESDAKSKQTNVVTNEHAVDFDEALSRLGFGRFNYSLILISGIIITATSFETIGIGFVFPVAECDLQLSTQQKGTISSISSIGIIISSHIWGFLSDCRGRKNVIVPTLIMSFISTLLSSLSVDFTTLVVFRFFSGFFIAGSSSTIYAYLGEFHSSKHRSKALMAASFIFGLACNYMPVLGFFLLNRTFHFHIPFLNIEYKPWRVYLLLCGLPSFICAVILVCFFPESPKYTFTKGKEAETLNILERIYRMNNPDCKTEYNVTKLIEDVEFIDNDSREITNVSENPILKLWKQTCLLFTDKYVKKTVLICLMQCGLFASTHGLYMFFPDIVDKVSTYSHHSPLSRATMCEILHTQNTTKNSTTCSETFENSTFGYGILLEVLYMLGFLVITFIINRVSKLAILTVILFGCAASGFSMQIVTLPILSIYFYVIFMQTLLTANVIYAVTIDLFPTHLRGMAINLTSSWGRIGSVLGTNVVGATLDKFCSSTFAVSAGIMFACGLLSFLIPKIRHDGGGLQQQPKDKK